MKEFLVGLENLYCNEERVVTVTDDVEGFGPSLLAWPGIRRIRAHESEPWKAARSYIWRYNLEVELPLEVSINLTEGHEEWRAEKSREGVRLILQQ